MSISRQSRKDLVVFLLVIPIIAVTVFYMLVPSPGEPAAIRFARFFYGERFEEPVSWQRVRATADTVRALSRALVRADSRERALAVAHADAAASGGAILRATPDVSADARSLAAKILTAELDSLGASQPRHPVAVVVMVDSTGTLPRYSRAIVLPETPGAPCTVVLRLSPKFPRFSGTGATDRLLGTCGFYAAYGTPGAGMQAWLMRSKMRSAGYAQRPESHADGVMRDPAVANVIGRNPWVVGCRAGRMDACTNLFDGEDWREERIFNLYGGSDKPVIVAPELPNVAVVWPTDFGQMSVAASAGLLASTAEMLGRERFTRMWTNDAAPAESFAAVANEPLTAWLQRHLDSYVIGYRAGPGLAPMQWLSMLVLALVAAVLASRFTKRQLS